MIHINRYIDKVRTCDTKRMKDVTLSMKEAKDLHTDITKLLLALQELQKPKKDEEITKVEITGGDW